MSGIGLFTKLFADLSPAIRALMTTVILLVGLAIGLTAVIGQRIGATFGKTQGDSDSRALFPGGLTGALSGATFFSILTVFIVLVITEHSERDIDLVSGPAVAAIFLCTALGGAVLAARWKWTSNASLALSSAWAVAVIMVVTLNMVTLLPKIVLLIILLIFSLITVFLLSLRKLSPRLSSKLLCALSSCLGSVLFFVAIDIWIKTGFIDATSLFITPRGVFSRAIASEDNQIVVLWLSPAFKGLNVGLFLVAATCTAIQLWTYSKYGESPDQSWNDYMGNYVSTRQVSGRKGAFEERKNIWKRLFSSAKYTWPVSRFGHLHDDEASLDEFDLPPLLKQQKSFTSSTNSKRPYQYDANTEYGYEEWDPSKQLLNHHNRPVMSTALSKTSSVSKLSGETLVNSAPSRTCLDEALEAIAQAKNEEQTLGRKIGPDTFKKNGKVRSTIKSLFGQSEEPVRTPRSIRRSSSTSNSLDSDSLGLRPATRTLQSAPVEATPSLIRAVERISEAQRQARNWNTRKM